MNVISPWGGLEAFTGEWVTLTKNNFGENIMTCMFLKKCVTFQVQYVFQTVHKNIFWNVKSSGMNRGILQLKTTNCIRNVGHWQSFKLLIVLWLTLFVNMNIGSNFHMIKTDFQLEIVAYL